MVYSKFQVGSFREGIKFKQIKRLLNQVIFHYSDSEKVRYPELYKVLRSRYFRVAEGGFIVAVLAGVMVHLAGMSVGSDFMLLLMSLLAFTYLMLAVFVIPFSFLHIKTAALSAASGMALYFLITGMAQKMYVARSSDLWIAVGISGLLLLLAATFFTKTSHDQAKLTAWRKALVARHLIYAVLGVAIYLIPKSQMGVFLSP